MSVYSATVVVMGVGARTPIGATAPASAAAARAGISGFGEHPFMVDAAGSRMIVAAAPYLSIDIGGNERFCELANGAAVQAIAPVASLKPPMPVFLGLPPIRPGRSPALASSVLSRIRESLAGFRLTRFETIETGHSAGAMAIQLAWEAVRSGAAEFALAGGVDSYLEPETLEWLEANDQLHSAGPENNAYGFIPGEAAGFVLLASAGAAERFKQTAGLELVTVATTRETKLIKTGTVCIGDGMTALFRKLAGEPPTHRADHLYCDMNGEPYRADEFGFATIKAGALFRDAGAFSAPADCWGDVGAASGPLYLLLMDAAVRRGYAPGPVQVAFMSSESGERCGFVTRPWRAKGVR